MGCGEEVEGWGLEGEGEGEGEEGEEVEHGGLARFLLWFVEILYEVRCWEVEWVCVRGSYKKGMSRTVCMMRYNSVRWSAVPYVGMGASR